MCRFASIDPILIQWANEHSITWYSEYQDTEVRVFCLNPDRRDRIQIAVDPPLGGLTTVAVGQNRKGLSRLHRIEKMSCSVSDLPETLDKVLIIGNGWLGETAD